MDSAISLNWSAVVSLIPLIYEFKGRFSDLTTDDLHELASKVGLVFGVDDVDDFMQRAVESSMFEAVKAIGDEESARTVASVFSSICGPVMSHVVAYARGDIGKVDLVGGLNDIAFGCVDELGLGLTQALGIDPETAKLIAGKLGPYTVTVYCFVAAFKIYQQAAHDAAIARERRLEAERLSREAVERLQEEHAEMQRLVSAYMLDRIPVFSEGVSAMDQAILDNDDDGYIAANATLWNLFGHEAQYQSAQEFDDLMLSDEAFKL